MNKSKLRQIIREELKIVLSEVYQDKFKISGRLITNIKERPQKEVLSDIKILEENKKIIDNLQLDIDKLSDLHKEL